MNVIGFGVKIAVNPTRERQSDASYEEFYPDEVILELGKVEMGGKRMREEGRGSGIIEEAKVLVDERVRGYAWSRCRAFRGLKGRGGEGEVNRRKWRERRVRGEERGFGELLRC